MSKIKKDKIYVKNIIAQKIEKIYAKQRKKMMKNNNFILAIIRLNCIINYNFNFVPKNQQFDLIALFYF